MKFNFAKAATMLSIARIAVGASAGNPVDAASAAGVVSEANVYNRSTATDFRRVVAFSALVALLKFFSAPALSAILPCVALFMATILIMVGFAVVLRQNPLGTSLIASVIICVLYGLGVASVICAFNLAVGHPLEVSIVSLGIKTAADCAVYLVLCWFCDKVLKRCRRL